MKQQTVKKERGVAALVVIVLVGAAALLFVQGSALLGLGELDLGYTSQKGSEAFSVADGCMEEALQRMRLSTSYTGGSLDTSNGSPKLLPAPLRTSSHPEVLILMAKFDYGISTPVGS